MARRPPHLALFLVLAGCAREPEPTPAVAAVDVGPAVAPPAVPVAAAAVAPTDAQTPPDDHHRLHSGEGTLAIDVPSPLATQHAATVTLTLTAAPGFRVNADFPIRLALVPPAGLVIAKPALTRADAVASDDNHLVLAAELVASEAGSYALTGRFKFALCQRDVCLSKDEPIAIELIAR